MLLFILLEHITLPYRYRFDTNRVRVLWISYMKFLCYIHLSATYHHRAELYLRLTDDSRGRADGNRPKDYNNMILHFSLYKQT